MGFEEVRHVAVGPAAHEVTAAKSVAHPRKRYPPSRQIGGAEWPICEHPEHTQRPASHRPRGEEYWTFSTRFLAARWTQRGTTYRETTPEESARSRFRQCTYDTAAVSHGATYRHRLGAHDRCRRRTGPKPCGLSDVADVKPVLMKNLKRFLNVPANGHASSGPGAQLGVPTHKKSQSLADIPTTGMSGRINSVPEAEALSSKCTPRRRVALACDQGLRGHED